MVNIERTTMNSTRNDRNPWKRKKYQNLFKLGASAGTMALLLAACGTSTTTAASKTTVTNPSSKSSHLTPITVSLALDPPKMIFIGFWVAKYEGFFQRNGLNVKLVPELSGVQAARAQATGTTIFSASGTDTIAASAEQGGGQIGIGSFGKDDLSIIAQPSVKTIQDLRGKNVGLGGATGPANDVMTLALQKAGIPRSAIHFDILNGRPALVGALVSGQISASVFHIDDGLTAISKDPSLHVLESMYTAAPNYWYGPISVNKTYANTHQSVVEEFLTAMVQADRWMYTHKSAVVQLGVKYTGETKSIVSQSYDFLAARHAWPENAGTTKAQIRSTMPLFVADKTIKSTLPVNKVFTFKYIDKVLQKLGTVKD